jgi:hypothetical protein
MMMIRLHVISILILLMAGTYTAKAQTVTFCADVKENGEMVNPATTFAVTKKGGTIKMVVTLDHKVQASKVVYKIFKVTKDGDQVPEAVIEDEVTPDWLWFYHDLMIRSPGNFIVFVYLDGSTEILASGMVHIIPAKEK